MRATIPAGELRDRVRIEARGGLELTSTQGTIQIEGRGSEVSIDFSSFRLAFQTWRRLRSRLGWAPVDVTASVRGRELATRAAGSRFTRVKPLALLLALIK